MIGDPQTATQDHQRSSLNHLKITTSTSAKSLNTRMRVVTRTWFNSTRRLDATWSQIRVIQGDCKVSMCTQVKQWSAVKLRTALVCTANGLFYARIAEGNFHRAKIDTPLLLPNTSVLVTPQTMVHEDRGTCLLHFNSVIVNKWSLSWWITAECRLLHK